MTTRMLTMVLCVVLTTACTPPPDPDLGPRNRQVRVSPTIRTVTDGVVTHTELPVAPTWWGNPSSVPLHTANNRWVFTVPPGPALIQFGQREYVYSDADSLRPCVEGLSLVPHFYVADGGMPFDLVLAAPSSGSEVLHVRGAPVPWLTPDAGLTEVHQRLNVAVERTGGPVTLVDLQFEGAGTSARVGHAIAVADAGVLDPSAPAVSATFTALSPGTPLSLDWDRPALTALLSGNNARVPSAMLLRVMQGQTWLAQVYDPEQIRETLTVPLPGETPTHYEVWSNGTRLKLDGEESDMTLSFAVPWPSPVSIVPSGGPARDVVIVDGASVQWTAPSPAPGAYLVTFFDASGGAPLGTMFTDQVSVPVPPMLRGAAVRVEVEALSGGGVSAAGCPLDYKVQGAPWSQFVSASR